MWWLLDIAAVWGCVGIGSSDLVKIFKSAFEMFVCFQGVGRSIHGHQTWTWTWRDPIRTNGSEWTTVIKAITLRLRLNKYSSLGLAEGSRALKPNHLFFVQILGESSKFSLVKKVVERRSNVEVKTHLLRSSLDSYWIAVGKPPSSQQH